MLRDAKDCKAMEATCREVADRCPDPLLREVHKRDSEKWSALADKLLRVDIVLTTFNIAKSSAKVQRRLVPRA
jgi:hypothetical protein